MLELERVSKKSKVEEAAQCCHMERTENAAREGLREAEREEEKDEARIGDGDGGEGMG